MIALSEFLAKHILSECYGTGEIPDEKQPEVLAIVTEHVQEGIRLYQEHLKTDAPRTVNWMMIETQLIIALGHMEDPAKSKAERNGNETGCPSCRNTGKPCESCGEFHTELSMCPPHEVRSNQYSSCPTCGKFRWQCKRCGFGTANPKTVRHRTCSSDAIDKWKEEDTVICDNCGSKVVRNGTMIKCFNCGNSIGCS